MAARSKGTPPGTDGFMDMNQAAQWLDTAHHFTLQTMNRCDAAGAVTRKRFACKVTHAGRRYEGNGRTLLEAVNDAKAGLAAPRRRRRRFDSGPPRLRLAGFDTEPSRAPA